MAGNREGGRDMRDKRRGTKNILLGMLPLGEPQDMHWESQPSNTAHRIQIPFIGYQVHFPKGCIA